MKIMKNWLTGSFFDTFFFSSIIVLLGIVSFCPPFILEQHPFWLRGYLLLIFAVLVMNKGLTILRKSDLPLWVFLVALGINVFFARETSVALGTYINLAVIMLCVYYITAAAVTSSLKFDILVKTICLFSVLSALWGIIDTVAVWNPLYEFYLPNLFYDRYKASGFLRAMSTHCNPVVFGSYLVAGFPFLILLAQSQKDLRQKIAGYFSIAIVTIAILLTCSRGIFMAFVASLIVLLIFLSRDKVRHSMYVLVAVLVFVIACSFLPYPFAKYGIQGFVFYEDGIVSSYRLARASMAGHMLSSSPFAGIGFQHFRILFNDFQPLVLPVPYEFMIADNMYLTMLAETGIAGFFSFLLFMFFVFKKIAALKRARIFSCFLLASLTALLINMGAYELFYWFNPYIYFCLLIGLVEGLWRNTGG
jgi:putative inorganic carbon (HCO3(-)) transporter